jgi:hypothetical protein
MNRKLGLPGTGLSARHTYHASIKTLNGVILMTPENIHLNAFMYEPILDMSDEHLKKLYKEINDLK